MPVPKRQSKAPKSKSVLQPVLKKLRQERERFSRFDCIIAAALRAEMKLPFPLEVFPATIRAYIEAYSASIFCSYDLLAVPLLAVAGAAVGRAGRRLLVKAGYEASSCLWTVCIASSSTGKSPCLNAVDCFYVEKQREQYHEWVRVKKAHDSDPKKNPEPGARPQLFLTDTTTEALRYVLLDGPTLYRNDELASWCHQMSQYKSGNADKPAWTSFWSHAPVSVGRRSDSLYVERPFVSVTGMMVPGSAHELNYRGHDDDGFVHRMLIACPTETDLVFTPTGVPASIIEVYKQQMRRLFEAGGTLRMDRKAFASAAAWINNVHYAEVAGSGAPDWMKAKYKKLADNLWRVALVLHELRRVAETKDERQGRPFSPEKIDTETIERAIKVINYFKDHIARVQNVLGDMPTDDLDGLYRRFRGRKQVTVREFMIGTTYKKASRVKEVFAEWQKRNYGTIRTGNRKDQLVFEFGQSTETVTDCYDSY